MQEELSFSKRDEFQRKAIAETMIQLLKPEVDLSPIVIDGDWGTGKTEFSIKLKNLVIESEPESRVVYIDAFKGDHAESPLLLITSAIASILPKDQQSSFIKKAIPAIRFGLKTTLKAGAGWILKQEIGNVAEEFQDAMKTASNAAIDNTIENLLKDHIESDKNIKSLISCIEEISQNNKTIIIIDELDRCKPSFSTSILETIKHIFDTKNVFFILVANTEQLRASINHTYGYSVNSQKYLDKFIKYTIKLPDSFLNNRNEICNTSVTYWNQLSQENDSLKLIQEHAGAIVKDLIIRTHLTLRETQTFARNLYIFQKLNEDRINDRTYFIYRMIVIAAVFIHCFGDKNILLGDLTADSIDSIARTFNIDEIPYNSEAMYKTPRIIFLFYGIIRDNLSITTKFSPTNINDVKEFDNIYQKLEDADFFNTTIKEQINKVIAQMSFIN